MKLSAKITRNRIVSTLRWIGLSAINDGVENRPAAMVPAASLARFENAAKRAGKLKPGKIR